MEYSDLPQIQLAEEIKMLNCYLQLEALRFDNGFDYTITCSIGENESVKIPPLIIQPIVENAIIHGLMQKKNQRSLTIDFSLVGDQLRCEIMDNGIGRIEAAKNKKAFARESKGILLSRQRISIFNKSVEEDNMSIEDLYHSNGTASGTKVTLLFRIHV